MHRNKSHTNNRGSFATFDHLKKVVSKVIKIALRICEGLLILIFVISLLTSLPAVQTYLAKSVANSLSESLQTEVSIQKVSLGFTGKIHIENVLIKDRAGDSLFFIHDLKARVRSINQTSQTVILRSVALERALVNFTSQKDKPGNNYQFVFDFFAAPAGSGGGIWTIRFTNLKLKESSFRYKVYGYQPPTDRDFDESDFAFNHINGEFKDFAIIGDSLDFKVKKLSTTEKNGLRVKRMVCKAAIHGKGMSYKDLLLETDRSRLEDEITFGYSNYPALSQFVDSVYLTVRLTESNINVNDLAYFSHSLSPYIMNNIAISADARGYIRRFKVKKFDMQLGNHTLLKGTIDLTGLPEWRSCFTDLDIEEFRTTPDDIMKILALKSLPNNIDKFEDALFSGHLTGFYTDFAADGVLVSSLGTLRSRIHFKMEKDDVPKYNGVLVAEDFNVGYLLDQSNIGFTSFSFDLEEGVGFNLTNLKSRFNSTIHYLDVGGYRFKKLISNGLYTNKSFDGLATLDDENAKFTFSGKMDFNPDLPTYNFKSTIDKLNLRALKIDSLETSIAAVLDINLSGSEMDNLTGEAIATDLHIKRGAYKVDLEQIMLFSGNDSLGRHVELRSDIMDASITGSYNFSYLDLVYADILNTLFPDYYVKQAKLPQVVDMNASITLRKNTLIGHLLQQDLMVGNGKIDVNYNSGLKSLEVDGLMDVLNWENYRFENYYLNMRKRPHQLLNMSTDVAKLFYNDSLLTHSILLNASILPNDIDFLFNFADTTDHIALRSYGALHFGKDSIGLQLMSSNLYTSGRRWKIDDDNQLWYDRQNTLIEHLFISNGNQMLRCSGLITEKTEDRLVIHAENLDLDNFNDLLGKFNVQVGGVASGDVSIFRILNDPFVHANLNIHELVYASDTLGNFHIETESSADPLLMNVNAFVEEGLLKDVSFNGTIDLRDNNQKFDLNISIKEASVKPLELIFKGVASNFEGTLSAQAKLKGTVKKHSLKGKVQAYKVGFNVDYLGTRYFINDEIILNEKVIDFGTMVVKDINGNSGVLKGTITHNLFSDFYLDLRVDNIKNMLCLNTTSTDNSAYYGTGVGSGRASFKGYLDNLIVDITASAERGTKITIPIYSETDNQLVDYIRFKQIVDTSALKPVKTRRNKIDGLVVKMAFTITEDAQFELLFDEILDDRITGSGTGNISMEYTSYDDFYMFGDIRIKEGIYPFSSPTLVSEKFDLREGGRITWNGDPYNATINLQASVARNRANPQDLMLGFVSKEDLEKYNTNIRMNVIMYLKGDLFSPEITFGMEFPDNLYTSGLTQFNSLIKKVENDPDELNRQVFSLLTFGSFTPTANYSLDVSTSSNKINDIMSSSVGSFLSNQVNNWISEYDKNWELGVNYKTRTGITEQEKADLIVSIRRKFMDERLEVAGSYNAYATGSINPYNVDLIYNVKKDGTLKLKVYHKLANDPTLGHVSNVTTSGVGFYFKKQFEKIGFGRKSEGIKPEEIEVN